MQTEKSKKETTDLIDIRLRYKIDGEKYECFAQVDKELTTFGPDDITIHCLGLLGDVQVSPEDVEADFIEKTKSLIMNFFFDIYPRAEISEIRADISDRDNED